MFPIKSVQDYMYPYLATEELFKKQIENQYLPQSLLGKIKEQELVNQYYGPKAEAMIDLIRSGQIPHYQAQNALIHQGQIPHLIAQNSLLNEQAQEQGLKNEFTREQWKQWKTLQDEINRLNEQQNSGGYSYPANMPNLSEVQQRRIEDSLNNSYTGLRGQIDPQTLQQALSGQQQPKILPQQAQQPQMPPPVQQEQMPNQLTQPIDNAERIAALKDQQQRLFGNVGKLGVETPLSKEERAEKLAEKRENIKIYSQELKSANEGARDAIQMKNLIDQFQSAYSKLENKGPVLGRLPAVTSEQQIADNAAQNMQQMMVKLMKTNRMTNYELQFAGNLKLNRAMKPQTVKEVGDFLKAKSERLTEEPKFINAAKNKGLSAEDAKVLWNEYENERPVYNFENRKINKDNLNKSGEYLTPEALAKINNPGEYSPTAITANPSQNIEQEKVLNGVRYVKINGEWHQT